MPITAPDGRLHVAVGILLDGNLYLMQQRIPGQPCAGQWEFPGGKLEPGESSRCALERELREELGVEIAAASLLMQLPFDYEHARVWLDIFMVDRFEGEVSGREGQRTRWLTLEQIPHMPVLDAVQPILEKLRQLQGQNCSR